MDLFLKMIRTRNPTSEMYRQTCLASLKLTANTPENRPSALKEKDRLPTKKHFSVVFAVRFRDGLAVGLKMMRISIPRTPPTESYLKTLAKLKGGPRLTSYKSECLLSSVKGEVSEGSPVTTVLPSATHRKNTVDGRNPAPVEVGVGSLSTIIWRILYIPGGCLGFLPSTVLDVLE